MVPGVKVGWGWSHGVKPSMDVLSLSVCYPRLKDFHLFKCALSKMAKRPLAIAVSAPVPGCHVKFMLRPQWLKNTVFPEGLITVFGIKKSNKNCGDSRG